MNGASGAPMTSSSCRFCIQIQMTWSYVAGGSEREPHGPPGGIGAEDDGLLCVTSVPEDAGPSPLEQPVTRTQIATTTSQLRVGPLVDNRSPASASTIRLSVAWPALPRGTRRRPSRG